MAKKELEQDDPFEIHGVEMPGQTEEQLRDMVLCVAEEFIREGWDEERLLQMFQNPFYQGPYLAWKQKGDAYVLSIIREAMKMWRPASIVQAQGGGEARPEGQPVHHKVSAPARPAGGDSSFGEKGGKP